MQYISTRGAIQPLDFCDAVMMGLADDNGLIIPEKLPDFRPYLQEWNKLSYSALAFQIMQHFISDIPADKLTSLINSAYSPTVFSDPAIAPVKKVGNFYVLELFHGPTLAFKDMALQFLGRCFEYILGVRNTSLNILAATSGDTGSSAIAGVRGRKNIRIFVMHPHERTSLLQRRQMTTVHDDNVHNIAIQGVFDDTQRILKNLFADLEFKKTANLGAVNSVNWARVLAQIVYYGWASFQVREQLSASAMPVFSVPTGNFGDILAGWYAKQLGFPIGQLVLATNENDILCRFFTSGNYERGQVHATMSPSMDIQVASNFERYLFYRLGSDSTALRSKMQQFSDTGKLEIMPISQNWVDYDIATAAVSEAETLETIKKVQEKYAYILDPHTAVGWCAAEKCSNYQAPVVVVATAHPAKFPDAIDKATGIQIKHPELEVIKELREDFTVLPATDTAVRNHINQILKK